MKIAYNHIISVTKQFHVSVLASLFLFSSLIVNAQTQEFLYTGSVQTYTVPAGVFSLNVKLYGAQGGGSVVCGNTIQDDGGKGGYAEGLLAVTPGQVLYIYVGGKPTPVANDQYSTSFPGGFNGGGGFGYFGGGGGGASDIRLVGNGLGDRVIVAGGGGGGNTGCPDHGTGAAGGGLIGGTGQSSSRVPGGGGTQTGGGAGGTSGFAGSFGQGGTHPINNPYHYAGGGGGWYGGGSAFAGGGGGGSSYIGGVTNGTTQGGVRDGNGFVTITIQNITYYADADADGFGDPNTTQVATSQPPGYVPQAGDCDDTKANVNPAAAEVCDGLDNDCDGIVDEGLIKTFYADADGDGVGNAQISIQACTAPQGYVATSGDCNDADATIYPGAPELCDGKDHNCDGVSLPGTTFTFSVSNVTCGLSNGSITVSATGGSSPFSYSINSGAYSSTNVFSGLSAGVYRLKVRGSNGCESPEQLATVLTNPDVTPPGITCQAPVTVNSDQGSCSAIVTFNKPVATDNCSSQGPQNGVHTLNRGQQFFDYANQVAEVQNSPGLPMTFSPTDGNKMAVFLQNGGSTHYLYQDVNMPATGPINLSFDLKYTNHNGTFNANQFIAVEIRSTSTNAILRTLFKTDPGAAASTPMTSYSFDVSEFAGQRVRIEMIDASINSFYLDVLLDNVKVTGSSLVNGSFETGDYTGWTIFSSISQFGTWGIGTGPAITVSVNQIAGLPSGSAFPVGTTTNTFEAVDASGNKSVCSFTVTVQDNTLPIVITRPVTIALDATGNATLAAADVNNNSSDACGIKSIAVSQSDFDCTNVGDNIVTLTVIDNNNNVSTGTATVTIQDVTGPVARAKDITIQLDTEGHAVITPEQVDNGSSDACGVQTLQLNKTVFDCSHIGANEVMLTVTDKNGNVSAATSIITVEDNVAPIAKAKNITVALGGDGTATIAVSSIDDGSSDNCGIASITLSQTSFDCTNIGSNAVTLTVTDVNGNVSTALASVNIEDNISPVVKTKDITVYLSSSGGVNIAAGDIDDGSTDNCGIASLSVSTNAFDCSDIGTRSVMLTVTDASGNQSSGTATVTIVDNLSPDVNTNNVTITLNAAGQASITVNDINNGSSDNCGVASITLDETSFDCDDVGSNVVTLTVTDVNGNVAAGTAIVVVENPAPVLGQILGPIAPTQINAAVTLSAGFTDSNLTAATWNWGDGSTSAGTIGGGSVTGSHAFTSAGVYTVILTITDVCGETAEGTFRYVVVYDPNGGFVTGGGWFYSPTGAYMSNPALTGKANFGFVSKYQKGSTVPQGNTDFQFQAGDLKFKSTSYDWLVIAGHKAMYKGVGELNGASGYGFQISAVDGEKKSAGTPDKFRIKIWLQASEVVVYDNQLGAANDAEATTALGGGSIVIHESKDRNSSARVDNTTAELTRDNPLVSEITAYPNPFTDVITVTYFSPETQDVQIELMNTTGKIVYDLKHKHSASGAYVVDLRGRDLSQEIYLLRMKQGTRMQVLKVIRK